MTITPANLVALVRATERAEVAAIAHELLSAADAPVLDVERIGDLFKRLATVYSQIARGQ